MIGNILAAYTRCIKRLSYIATNLIAIHKTGQNVLMMKDLASFVSKFCAVVTVSPSSLPTLSCIYTTTHVTNYTLRQYTKMPSSSQHSASTPFLSTSTSHHRDDNVPSIGSSRHSGSVSTLPSPCQRTQHPQQQRQAKQGPAGRATIAYSWKWEFGSAILLLISVAAIPATLYPHDGQPLPRWPFSISINALLSIYAMVLKASLGFLITSCIGQLQWSWYLQVRPLKDVVHFYEAAHGALGSMQWLCVHRLRQPLTALGALTTLLALAIDPFTQQLVRAVDCSETFSKDTRASVPRTNYVKLGLQNPQDQTDLQSTIMAGLFTFPNLTDFDCSTGNCTFQNTYSSLSFCSQCSDRSSEVAIDEQCRVESYTSGTDGELLHKGPGPCNARGNSEKQYTYFWNLTTSWPLLDLNFYYQQEDFTRAGRTPKLFSIQGPQIEKSDQGFYVPQDLQFAATLGYSDSAALRLNPRFTSGVTLTGCNDSATNDTWHCRGYGAAACVLQPCVRTYSCSIDAGRVNETIIEELNLDQLWGSSNPGVYIGDTLEPPPLGLLDLHCITDDDRGNLIHKGYNIETAGRWLLYNVTFLDPLTIPFNASSPFPESLLANECLYVIDVWSAYLLGSNVLLPFLIGSVTRDDVGFDGDQETREYTFSGKEKVVHLYNSGNVSMASIDEMFTNLAQVLTLWIRSKGDARLSRRAQGDVLHYAVCLRVTWAWIALPAALTGLTLVMLALTVATTARRAVPMWKLFPLAVLLRGPAGDDWLDRDLLTTNTSKVGKTSSWDGSVTGMSELASRVFVQLLEQDGKFKLRQVGVQSKKV